MDVLARRTITSSGEDVLAEVVSTGNGVMLKAPGCPLVHLTMTEAHRLLARFSRAAAEGEGITGKGAKAMAVWGELV